MAYLILGAGYVGRALLDAHPGAIGTHRKGKPLRPCERVLNLEDPATWVNIAAAQHDVVWTFPAAPIDRVREFYERHLKAARSLIVLGSTSAYRTGAPDQTIDENSPVDTDQPRVQGEEWLKQHGAVILRLAGIFGPDRTPLNWLKKGLIKNGRKRLNLIHLDDILAAVEAITIHGLRGITLNGANGESPTWNEIVARYQKAGELPEDFSLPQEDPGAISKLVDNQRLRKLLPNREFLKI